MDFQVTFEVTHTDHLWGDHDPVLGDLYETTFVGLILTQIPPFFSKAVGERMIVRFEKVTVRMVFTKSKTLYVVGVGVQYGGVWRLKREEAGENRL